MSKINFTINGKSIDECNLSQIIIKTDESQWMKLLGNPKEYHGMCEFYTDEITLYDCQCYMKRKNRFYFKDKDGIKFIIELKQ